MVVHLRSLPEEPNQTDKAFSSTDGFMDFNTKVQFLLFKNLYMFYVQINRDRVLLFLETKVVDFHIVLDHQV